MPHDLKDSDLKQFTGTDVWYRHGLYRKVSYTEGVKYMADHAGAYWLIDEIALTQLSEKKVREEPMQFWKLQKDAKGHGALLTCEDGGKDGNSSRIVYKKKIEYTDFPLFSITLWFTDSVILLPSEY
jgi:uncharacterized protein DUF6876